MQKNKKNVFNTHIFNIACIPYSWSNQYSMVVNYNYSYNYLMYVERSLTFRMPSTHPNTSLWPRRIKFWWHSLEDVVKQRYVHDFRFSPLETNGAICFPILRAPQIEMSGLDVDRFERHLAAVVVPRVSCDQTRNVVVRITYPVYFRLDGFCARRRIL